MTPVAIARPSSAIELHNAANRGTLAQDLVQHLLLKGSDFRWTHIGLRFTVVTLIRLLGIGVVEDTYMCGNNWAFCCDWGKPINDL
jgi:hypothetical protein